MNDAELARQLIGRQASDFQTLVAFARQVTEDMKTRERAQGKGQGKRDRGTVNNIPGKKDFKKKKTSSKPAGNKRPAGCPEGTCYGYFRNGKCGFHGARKGRPCRYKHDVTAKSQADKHQGDKVGKERRVFTMDYEFDMDRDEVFTRTPRPSYEPYHMDFHITRLAYSPFQLTKDGCIPNHVCRNLVADGRISVVLEFSDPVPCVYENLISTLLPEDPDLEILPIDCPYL